MLGSRLSRREFLCRSALLAAVGALAGCEKPHGRVLNFYNWSNYIAPDSPQGPGTISQFEREFGVHVNYDNFSSQDVLYAKMRIGVFGYDLIVATDYKLQKFIKHGLVEELDIRRIPNLANLYPRFRTGPWDPGNRYSVPWQWGTTGIGYNSQLVHGDCTTWRALFDEKYAHQIDMLDEMRDAIGCTLMMLGYDGNSLNPRELAEAQAVLIKQRPLVKHYTSDTYIDELASGDAWLCQGWSGDIGQARDDNDAIKYEIPREGSFMWVDCLCVPRRAPHYDVALEFMNFILRPDVGAQLSNAVSYASPNQAAEKFISPELLHDPKVYPPPDVMKRLTFTADLGDEEDRYHEVWNQVKLAE
ncbi:MAG: ABC transporter substrate-binding protein [Candidatus Xenobia bacterium]